MLHTFYIPQQLQQRQKVVKTFSTYLLVKVMIKIIMGDVHILRYNYMVICLEIARTIAPVTTSSLKYTYYKFESGLIAVNCGFYPH